MDDTNKILYLCDRKACSNCSYPECKHTTNICHAVNFECLDEKNDVWQETVTDYRAVCEDCDYVWVGQKCSCGLTGKLINRNDPACRHFKPLNLA